jgi:nucleoside-diphosphate-sugar epimerase
MAGGKNKILVTGASGFVGSALLTELRKTGAYKVFGLVGNRTKIEASNASELKLFQTDITDYNTLKQCEELKNMDTLVHTAGLAHQFGKVGKEDFWNVNVQGTENICRLAQSVGAGHFILISSVSVYGDYKNAEIDETFVCQPSGFYAESKLESEKRAIEFCEQNKIPLTILRLATVIGEGDRGNTTRLITTIDRRRFVWVGNGSNKKSLIYKNDAARGIRKTVETTKKDGTEIYNLTAEPVSMAEIVGVISANLHKKTLPVKIPESLVRGFFRMNRNGPAVERLKKIEKTFEKWLSDDIFSGKKFNERYQFEPETPITAALAKQVDYYLKQKNKSLE